MHQLEMFFYVAKYLSISKAANHLCISQPAVSSQIKKLENHYDIKLIEKNGRGIRLTYTGEQLYESIRQFFSTTIIDVESLLKNSRCLKISGNYLMTQFIVPEILGEKEILNKSEKIIIKSMSSFSAMSELKKEYCDLVLISSSELVIPQLEFIVTELFDDEIIFMSKGKLEDRISSIIVSESKKEIRDLVGRNLKYIGEMPLTVVESTQDAIANIRINNDCGTFVSASFLKYFDDEFNYISTGIKNKFYAIHRKDTSKNVIIRKVISELKESF
ncbi:LysR family transcriptional regulator [Enterococcus faecalis]|uniref:LysR family transcriptional regulator n=1 Tax=Enterococcus faecalis TaxID=1351 RepID=UPI00288D5682|nr:LysR family transcriptional regulator [Enterococcus faecalis]MDT2086715.1 LysR family transcriptional regulator [Enterococcus faecalis]